MPPDISIVIVAHNKAAYTRRCLDSLLLAAGARFQFLLFDNGSTDQTPAVFDRFAAGALAAGHSVDIQRADANIGAIISRNRCVERAVAPFIVFMDNDVTVRTRSWASRLRDALAADQSLGIVAPKMLFPHEPHLIQCAGCDVSPAGRVDFRGRGRPRDDPDFSVPRDCQALISATWMLHRAVWNAVGPLDTLFDPVQFEDIDYSYRVREKGLRCACLPSVEMYHWENTTTARSGAINYNYWTVKNNAKFKKKWQRVFEREDGPADAGLSWIDIPVPDIETMPEPPMVD
jgi:O-antigen biosynthesis protein